MNCKPGDLAIVVKSYTNQEGMIVRCIRLVDHKYFPGDVVWLIDKSLKRGNWIHDDQLRPIRPQPDDAVDEMVQKLGKPEGVTA